MILVMETETVHAEIEQLVLFEPVYYGRENRKSPRVAVDDPALLTVLELTRPHRCNVRVVDASKDGMKLLMPCRLAVGARLQILVRDLWVLADVRYCRTAGQLFYAGIRIQGQPEDRDCSWGDEKPQYAVGHTFPVNDHVTRDEVRGQCSNGEIQALEQQRREAKQQAKRRRQERRRRNS